MVVYSARGGSEGELDCQHVGELLLSTKLQHPWYTVKHRTKVSAGRPRLTVGQNYIVPVVITDRLTKHTIGVSWQTVRQAVGRRGDGGEPPPHPYWCTDEIALLSYRVIAKCCPNFHALGYLVTNSSPHLFWWSHIVKHWEVLVYRWADWVMLYTSQFEKRAR